MNIIISKIRERLNLTVLIQTLLAIVMLVGVYYGITVDDITSWSKLLNILWLLNLIFSTFTFSSPFQNIFILSFYIVDMSSYDKITKQSENTPKSKAKYNKIIIILII